MIPATTDPVRTVAVLTAVTENNAAQRRYALLMYVLVREIVAAAVIEDKATGQPIQYVTQLLDVPARRVADILPTLLTADVAVVVLNPDNAMISCELGIRAAARGEWILLVEGDVAAPALPVPAGCDHIRLDRGDLKQVLDALRQHAEEATTSPITSMSSLPGDVADLLSVRGKAFQSSLHHALQAIEQYSVPGPLVSHHAQYLSPRVTASVLNAWQGFCAFSIWRVRWHPKPPRTAYTPRLMIGHPTLVGGNELFTSLFAMRNFPEFPPDPSGPDALSLPAAVAALRRYVDGASYDAFARDQERLAREILLEGKFSQARVPITLTTDHPDPDFQGKSIMPCVFATRTVGDPTKPHTTYLLIVYTEAR